VILFGRQFATCRVEDPVMVSCGRMQLYGRIQKIQLAESGVRHSGNGRPQVAQRTKPRSRRVVENGEGISHVEPRKTKRKCFRDGSRKLAAVLTHENPCLL